MSWADVLSGPRLPLSARTQVAAFKKIQLQRHGIPKSIRCDREYNKGAFQTMCEDNGIKLVPSGANDHEANGSIEAANRVLRQHFNRLASMNKKASASELLQEATYAKNITKNNKLASSYELLWH